MHALKWKGHLLAKCFLLLHSCPETPDFKATLYTSLVEVYVWCCTRDQIVFLSHDSMSLTYCLKGESQHAYD